MGLLLIQPTRSTVYVPKRKTLSGNDERGISTSFAEEPSQHKAAHIIELQDGYFCAYPNNRILWAEPSMVSDPFGKIPDYKLNMQKYHCESHDKWATSDDDNFFYDITG
jgi:hypothetical protein